jgi:DNA polymerase III epsilon subunit-like protein
MTEKSETTIEKIGTITGKTGTTLLANADTSRWDIWGKILEDVLEDQGELYVFSDTETTGTELIDDSSKTFNRVLEWSLCFCRRNTMGLYEPILDKKGNPVVIDEPINPFIETQVTKKQQQSIDYIPAGSLRIHGITQDYLFGDEDGEGGRTKLPRQAGTIDVFYYELMKLLNISSYLRGAKPIYIVFHNAAFDIKFLNQEMEMIQKPPVESYFIPCDTLTQAKKILDKSMVENHTLDTVYKYGLTHYPEHIKAMDRPIHTSLLDSLILIEVYNTLLLASGKVLPSD